MYSCAKPNHSTSAENLATNQSSSNQSVQIFIVNPFLNTKRLTLFVILTIINQDDSDIFKFIIHFFPTKLVFYTDTKYSSVA